MVIQENKIIDQFLKTSTNLAAILIIAGWSEAPNQS